jgi:hypothetical protein
MHTASGGSILKMEGLHYEDLSSTLNTGKLLVTFGRKRLAGESVAELAPIPMELTIDCLFNFA